MTDEVVARLLGTCVSGSLHDLRDRATLMVAFGSGGRRRSEIASLRCEQIGRLDPVELPDGTKLPSIAIDLGRTRTSDGSREETVYLTGAPVDALDAWLETRRSRSAPSSGQQANEAIFLAARSMRNRSIPSSGSGPGLPDRNPPTIPLIACVGFLTEAALRNVSLLEAMDQSRHRSMRQAGSYYNDARRKSGLAAQLRFDRRARPGQSG